jgi:hypothetical protein
MERRSPLVNVREGMKVYDIGGDQIGTVQEVYFGSGGVTARDESPDNNILDIIETVFGNTYNMPDEVKQRLIRKGYVRIGGGLLTADRFILPEQISAVSDDSIRLRAEDDEILDPE